MSDGFPARRMRRWRNTPALRSARRETRLAATDLVAPLFVVESREAAGELESMPGVRRHTLDSVSRAVESLLESGLHSVLLFGVPTRRSVDAKETASPEGIIPRSIERIRQAAGKQLVIVTDVCLCSYTDHGHCGIVDHQEQIQNDQTLEVLSSMAVAHASAGADLVAPSGMMDGMVGAIRASLDGAGFQDVGILSYSVKYASALYGPFREAAESAPSFGDRRSYQMDPANVREALGEAWLDVQEGADAIMVKPALPYLDVIRALRNAHPEFPLAAYQVSGEYSMILAAAARGWLNKRMVALETLTAMKRAGADLIISYFAEEAAAWLREQD